MNAAMAAVIGASISGLVVLLGAIINAAVGRGGRRADIADRVSEASDRIFDRMDREVSKVERRCERCEHELDSVKKVLRCVVRSLDAEDHAAIDAAIAAARELV